MCLTINQNENASFLEKTALILLVVFLFWGHLRTTIVTSIPSILFLYLLMKEFTYVKETLIRNRLVLLLLGGVFFFTTVFSMLPNKSLKGVYDFSRGVIILVPIGWAVRYHSLALKKYIQSLLVVSIIISCAIAIFASMAGSIHEQRAFIGQIYVQYGTFGTSVGVLCVAAITFALFADSRNKSIFWGAAGAVSFLLILYSGSRGSLLATIVAILVLLGLCLGLNFYAVCVTVVTSAVALLYVLKTNYLGEWIASLNRPGDFSSYRFDIYLSLLKDWWEQGLLLGFGPNTFKFLEFGQVQNVTLMMPHNIYLEALTSMGLLGAFFFLLSQWYLLKKIDLKLIGNSSVTMLGGALLVFFGVRYMVDQKFWSTLVPGSIFFCYGLLGLFDSTLEPSYSASKQAIAGNKNEKSN